MLKNTKPATLADKISTVLSTAPISFETENDQADETVGKVIENDTDEQFYDDHEVSSKYRKQNIDLLEDIDVRYAGKKGNRKNLSYDGFEAEADESENACAEENSNDDINDEITDTDDITDNFDDADTDEVSDTESEQEIENKFKHIDITDQLRKCICVRNQLNIWESLLEIRIQLQKCLITANKMPRKNSFADIKSQSGEIFSTKISETKKYVTSVLDKLLQLQLLILNQYPETKNIIKEGKECETKSDDEEIKSDTDEEEALDELPIKRRKYHNYEEDIDKYQKKYREYRNSVIQKWDHKTRNTVTKNNPVHSVLDQIEYSLSNKTKLIKKTQIKRSVYETVGEQQVVNVEGGEIPEKEDVEIFDDDDFYHNLLRELIEVKSADITDPVQLGRQWVQLQNLRCKMKRKVDTKATKGRKIRYTVHSKLVNFMSPIDSVVYTSDAKTELFSSLFSKNLPSHCNNVS